MPQRRNKGGKKTKYSRGTPWSQNMGSGFYPSNIMPGPPMNPYMQAALGCHSAESMFGMGYSRGDYGGDYQYQYQQMENPYFRVSNKRFNNRGSRGRNNRSRRNKRPNAQGGKESTKKAKTNKQNTSTAEEEGNADEAGNEGSSHEQSSDRGANAPSQDWKNANDSQKRYCTVCEKDFVGSFFNHRRDINHRRNKDKKYPRCRLCRLTFSGFEEFEAHNATEEHKKMTEDFQVLKQQQQVHAALSDSEDEHLSLQRYIATQEPDNVSKGAEAVGLFHIVPMKVYFCKLCQKLFPNYMKGRHIHCRTPSHIQAYKVYFDGKEERAAERNRLKQEKKKEKALLKIRVRMERLARAKDEIEGEGAVEDVAVDEEDLSSDDEEDEAKQKEEDTEGESQLIREEEQVFQDGETAVDKSGKEEDATENQMEWQEEVINEESTDA